MKSKKMMIVGVLILMILLGVVFLFAFNTGNTDKANGEMEKTEESVGDTNSNVEDVTENTEKNNVETNDVETNGETGLEIEQKPGSTIDSVDGSGNWNEEDSNTDQDDVTSPGSGSDESILVDDKIWGDVN